MSRFFEAVFFRADRSGGGEVGQVSGGTRGLDARGRQFQRHGFAAPGVLKHEHSLDLVQSVGLNKLK